MRRDELAIDWVAPPFAGHLFPMLTIAKGLFKEGFTRQRVFSTPMMGEAVESLGLEFRDVLADREEAILDVANGNARVGARPWALVAQLKSTVGFLGELSDALDAEWASGAPSVAIVDSVLPSAGFAARRAGALWWTSMAALSPTETRTGTPAYLGGWSPGDGLLYRLRDSVGRGLTRSFKRTAAWFVRRELRALGVRSLYRGDGSEVCYSDDCILGLGHEAFEFERDWPAALRFVGCPTGSPVRGDAGPKVEPGVPHVLVRSERTSAGRRVTPSRKHVSWRSSCRSGGFTSRTATRRGLWSESRGT